MKEKDIDAKIESFIVDLKQGKLIGSYNAAYSTVHLLKKIVYYKKWLNAQELMTIIRAAGQKIIQAQPAETAVGNMVRRVLKIIREECAGHEEGDQQESLQKLMLAEGQAADFKQPVSNFKEAVIESIGELLTELETSTYNIAAQALDYIHSNEVVMTAGKSRTVEAFLKQAGAERKFQVIVAECAPFYHGQELATSLANDGIETTLITDSAVFAMMARVNKVIIGTHTVMANGGLKAINGSHALALAAKQYSVPLVVCAAMYKLSPQHLCSDDQDAFNKFVSPNEVLNFSEGEILSKVQVQNPVFDYVPPDLVTSFISNIGGNAPSYVYRLLNELYHPDDYDL